MTCRRRRRFLVIDSRRTQRAIVAACILIWGNATLACTSTDEPTVDDSFKRAAHVVMAEVIHGWRTAQSADPNAPSAVETVQFRVLVQWKGSYGPGAVVLTKTRVGVDACGLTIDPELRVLVATPASELRPGAVWILFLGGDSPHELHYDTGTARIGDGGELILERLYKLSRRR